jgi:hypothetical protein
MWFTFSPYEVTIHFFKEKTVKSTNYLDMLQLFAVPQMAHLQQDGAPPQWDLTVQESLNITFQNRWVARDWPIPWPSRSHDMTPLDFFLLGLCKGPGITSKIWWCGLTSWTNQQCNCFFDTPDAGKHMAWNRVPFGHCASFKWHSHWKVLNLMSCSFK